MSTDQSTPGGRTGCMAKTSEVQPDPSGVQAAIERYRDLAKYLVTVFAAIGGLLVAGTQLSTIGSLAWPENSERIVVGGIGFAVAILAAATIIWKALSVLRPVEISFDEAVEEVGRGKLRIPDGLLGDYETVYALKMLIEMSEPGSKQRASLLETAANVIDKAAYDQIASRFTAARGWMLGGALVGTVGILAAVWAANPPKDETAEPIARPTPTEVIVSLTRTGREVLSGSLGKNCDSDRISAITVGGTENSPRVLTLAENGCKLTQFSLPPTWGKATATRSAPATSSPTATGG